MSMEDIFKALVDSRQQGGPKSAQDDPMMGLIGSLLGGTQQGGGQQQAGLSDLMGGLLGGAQQGGGQQQAGLGSMMGLLETVIGSQGSTQASMGANNPIMGLLQPFVVPLAKKANIPPAIAMIVVSFVARKLLAHHPTSGRDSREFDFDDMLQQMNSGSINQDLLRSSGMVNELSRATGLDEATTTKTLNTAFVMVGKQFQTGSSKKPVGAKTTSAAAKTLKGRGSTSKAK